MARHKQAYTLEAAARAPKKVAPLKAVATKTRALAKPASIDDLSPEELRQRLAETEAQVKALEARLAAVTDRIAWITDRLHTLVNEGG